MPHLTLDHLDLNNPSPSGVRAQAIDSDGKIVEDFVFGIFSALISFIVSLLPFIYSPAVNVMHVRNAPSPACTSSLAIAKEIVDTASKRFNL